MNKYLIRVGQVNTIFIEPLAYLCAMRARRHRRLTAVAAVLVLLLLVAAALFANINRWL